jgi:hydrophobic/amphiphilic exporter-1 (mainly G- bacteria), HAE1 family
MAYGAGSASRNSVVTAVFGGMIVSTALNLLFVRVIYVVIASIRSPCDRADRLARHYGRGVDGSSLVAANYARC